MPNKVIVIAGPTASGKTRLGIELAKALDGEIVSADSMQVYKRMDIGTAKADAAERAQAVHHMLDVAEPWENYSVARYVEDAAKVCDDILARGKTPIIVGGTGLYIDSLIAGRDFADNQEDMALRRELDSQYDILGGEKMLSLLAEFDPERAGKLAATDRRRIIRAIEIYRLTGISATEHDRLTRLRPPRYDAARIVLNYKDRADLYARIDRRVELMDELGLFHEIEALLKEGLSEDDQAVEEIHAHRYRDAHQLSQRQWRNIHAAGRRARADDQSQTDAHAQTGEDGTEQNVIGQHQITHHPVAQFQKDRIEEAAGQRRRGERLAEDEQTHQQHHDVERQHEAGNRNGEKVVDRQRDAGCAAGDEISRQQEQLDRQRIEKIAGNNGEKRFDGLFHGGLSLSVFGKRALRTMPAFFNIII